MPKSKFRDQVVLLTGAASGIGLCLARALVGAGAIVLMCDRNGEALARAAASLEGPGRFTIHVLDVTDREGFQALAEDAVARWGRIDFLFNNAGIGVGGEAQDFTDDAWDQVIEVNLFGTIYGIQAVYPIMIEQGSGHIVNVASVAGLVPLAGEISYTASKYAVVGLTHTLRAEAVDLGVNVTLVCPGKIETPIYATSRVIGFDKEKVLSLWPKGITPEACAAEILRGVARNEATVVVTRLAKWLWRLQRLSPGLLIWSATRYMRKMRAFRTPEVTPRTTAATATSTERMA